jgi:hypothetical protein
MDDPQRYTELVQRLNRYGYVVEPDPHGYRVCSQSDPEDVSIARHLDDLEELADLVRWAAERQERREISNDFTRS